MAILEEALCQPPLLIMLCDISEALWLLACGVGANEPLELSDFDNDRDLS